MITTVCMNPSFDRTAGVERLENGSLHRLTDVRTDCGGKGLNVAKTLQKLGRAVQCVGCLGQDNAELFLRMIREIGFLFDYIPLPGEIRTNLKILDRTRKTVTEFNEPGPEMNPEQLHCFITLLKDKSAESEYVVMSGRAATGCPKDTVQQCLRVLEGKRCIVDTEGDTLLAALRENPFLIKPNLSETESIMKRELRTLPALRDAALHLIDCGAQNVVISMGSHGAMLVNRDAALFSPIVPVTVKSTVGAGDSMVGGMVYGLSIGATIAESFRYGVAAGTAGVMTEGTQPLEKDDFERLLPKVSIQSV